MGYSRNEGMGDLKEEEVWSERSVLEFSVC